MMQHEKKYETEQRIMEYPSAKTTFIVNPAAGGGAAGQKWAEVNIGAKKKLGHYCSMITCKPGDAAGFAKSAAERGTKRLLCFGGDGVLNEVINGILSSELGSLNKPAIGYIPCGTGMDFMKTAPIPRNWKEAIDVVAAGRRISIDIGKITFKNHQGEAVSRYFHNVASFGLGGEVDQKVNQSRKTFGRLSFFRAAFSAILKYGKRQIFISVDDRMEILTKAWNVAVCNGSRHGGGMKVAKDAKLDDGIFHITILADLNLKEILCKFPKLYSGNLKGAGMSTIVGRTIRAASREKVLIDVDGECPGALPVLIEMIPGAVDLIVDAQLAEKRGYL